MNSYNKKMINSANGKLSELSDLIEGSFAVKVSITKKDKYDCKIAKYWNSKNYEEFTVDNFLLKENFDAKLPKYIVYSNDDSIFGKFYSDDEISLALKKEYEQVQEMEMD
ncbi:hypothetical protein [Spiroplasma endosymbiont of Labia minor]|uniref:hypothetical protein n=1 Tax=Spiroplasma endosymbiont of Labia minor TaxID=3066305 RepID=UPI0030D4A889